MRFKGKLVAGAGAIMLVSAMGLSTAGAAAPPPYDVTHDTLACDTVTGSIKFPTALYISGTPGTATNQPTVAVALDGCNDTKAGNPGGVVISATKFKLTINTAPWANGGNHCDLDANPNPLATTHPSSPAGSGTHHCQAVWAVGGKFDSAVHDTDINGNFGANGFTALAGASSAAASNTDIAWKCAAALKAKCVDNLTTATPGHVVSHVQILNNYGTTGTDPFGTARGAFFVGAPLNGTNGIPAGTLSAESVTGAFQGNNGGATGTFEGMLQQSTGMLLGYLTGKGIKTLTFGVGDISAA